MTHEFTVIITLKIFRWVVAQLSWVDGILYLDIPRPELPVDIAVGVYGHEGEAYEDGYYGEEEAYGFASWDYCEGLDVMKSLVETFSF